MIVDAIGRAHDKSLLAYGDGAWHSVQDDGTFKPYTQELHDNTVSEWVNGSFETRGCHIRKRSVSCLTVEGAYFPEINGEYIRILGGYRNRRNDVWYVRSTAGQYVFVCSLQKETRVLGVQNCATPMIVNVSISSSEIKTLFQKKCWRQCKKLVWDLRMNNRCPFDHMFKVEVREIESRNKGRKARSFVC